ncbi:MAG: SpoIIE family protein phosphatase [Acidimicrobiales bacterium]
MKTPDELDAKPPREFGPDVALNLLRECSAALAGAFTLPEMLDSCARAVVRWLEVAFARVWVLSEDGAELILEASAGMYTHLDGAYSRVPVGEFKIGRIAASQVPHLSNDVEHDPQISDPAWARAEGMRAFAGYPLVAAGGLVGVLAMFSRAPLAGETLRVLEPLADSLALGIRRHRAEERLRAEHETVEFLHQIGTQISQQHTLEHIVQLVTDATTRMTDAQFGAFLYNSVSDAGDSYMLYTVSGPKRSLFDNLPMPRATQIFESTFKGQGTVRLADVTTDPRYGHNPPFNGLPPGHPPVRSYLAVPVSNRHGEVFGGLFFGHCQAGVFSDQHERIVEGTAHHAAIAIEGVRLHETEHRLAVELQRALLPSSLPEIEGATVAAHYEPASDIVDLGGDWYDVVCLQDGRLSVTVGDVMGHDLPAAAVMGQMRDAVRLYTFAGHEPVQTLQLVETYMEWTGITALCTVLHGTYDPRKRTLELVRAGNLPPMLLTADGQVTWLESQITAGAPLGAGLSDRLKSDTLSLAPGTRVVLMSDGLIERRGESLDAGMERAAAVLRSCASSDPDEICKDLLTLLAGSPVRDDAVVLVLGTPA